MERNHTMMQYFEWHLVADGKHWNNLRDAAPKLKALGIDAVWIPPVTKAVSDEDTGYGVYDLYDLGEFDQKGNTRTKYGSRADLHEAITSCQEQGINVYVDLVMNHKAGADKTETFEVVEVDGENRLEDISEPFEIEGWTKFTFPVRKHRYSSFKWNHEHFNGTDYDEKQGKTGFYRIVGDNKGWNKHVDEEFGNYDYLMFANLDYNHPEVGKEMISWGKWLASTLDCNGFRLDALKHISRKFIAEFAQEIMKSREGNFYLLGEYWDPDINSLTDYLEETEYTVDLFDVPLHYKLHEASQKGSEFDLTNLFDDTLVNNSPMNAVTFVDNHDSQPGQSLESWIDDEFKQSAYALILLRRDGFPCLFYGDYFGIGGSDPIDNKQEMLDPLLTARYHKAYGEQVDYFNHPNTIGWVRRGVDEFKGSGCAVVIANNEEGKKRMYVGKHRAREKWVDLTNSRQEKVKITNHGYGVFPVNAKSVSVWALAIDDE